MGFEDEYREFQRLPRDQRRAWLDAQFPDGVPIQWWSAPLEIAETDLWFLRRLSDEEARDKFEFAASLVELAIEGPTPACYFTYWMVRYAAGALRYDHPIPGLPEAVTPDGAARLALKHLPFTKETALVVAARRRREFQEEEEAYQRGEDRSRFLGEPFNDIYMLGELGDVVRALASIVDHISDPELAARVRSWIELLPKLAP